MDFFGTEVLDFVETEDLGEDFAELPFGFDVEDDRFVEDRDEEARPFWASDPMGNSRSAAAITRRQARVRINNL